MKKFALMLLAVVFATTQCNAQLLWKVTGNGAEKPSYILGTNHVAPVSMIDSITGLRDAIAAVDEVFGELSIEDLQSASVKSTSALMAPADSTLKHLFSPAELASIDSAFTAVTGAPMSITKMMNGFKPIALSTIFIVKAAEKSIDGFVPGKAFDESVLKLAADAGKPVKGLESAEQQIDLLFNSPIADQAGDLLSMVRMEGGVEKALSRLFDAYKAGDLDRIVSMLEDPALGGLSEDADDRLVNDRNEAWVDFLIGMLPTTSVLVVCGFGHLPGDKGLISRLRGAGFTVEPAVQ